MDMFRNKREFIDNDVVTLSDGRVALLFEEVNGGTSFVAKIYSTDGSCTIDVVYDEDILDSFYYDDGYEIKRNAVRCNECGDEIVSKLPYDYVRCSCGACTIDGGFCYIRRSVRTGAKYTELTIIE